MSKADALQWDLIYTHDAIVLAHKLGAVESEVTLSAYYRQVENRLKQL